MGPHPGVVETIVDPCLFAAVVILPDILFFGETVLKEHWRSGGYPKKNSPYGTCDTCQAQSFQREGRAYFALPSLGPPPYDAYWDVADPCPGDSAVRAYPISDSVVFVKEFTLSVLPPLVDLGA